MTGNTQYEGRMGGNRTKELCLIGRPTSLFSYLLSKSSTRSSQRSWCRSLMMSGPACTTSDLAPPAWFGLGMLVAFFVVQLASKRAP